jgi:uncharacterized protein
MLSSGEGIEVDFKQAFEYFKKATKGGILPAFHNLGNCYRDGKGTEVNYGIAVQCYEIAVKAGDVGAKTTLGNIFTDGKFEKIGGSILPATRSRGYQLIEEAALAGHPLAAYNMGFFAAAGSVYSFALLSAYIIVDFALSTPIS